MGSELNRIFGSRIRAKLLGWFFTHTDQPFFVRQIASILKEDPTNLSREMARMEELGILTSRREGRLRRYQVNRECPFYDELKGLVLKTVGVAGEIKTALDQLAGIEYAFLYGSYASGDEKATSDIDLVIVGDVDMDRLDVLMGDLEERLGREINYVLYSKREFKAKKRARDGFVTDVLAGEKIMLTGTEDGLSGS